MRIVLAVLLLIPALTIAGEVHFNAGARYEVGDGREKNEVEAALEVEYLFDDSGRLGVLVGSSVLDKEVYAALTTGIRQGSLRSYLGLGYGVTQTNPGYETLAPVLVPRRDSGYVALLGSEWSATDRLAIGTRYMLGKTDQDKIERGVVTIYLSAIFR